MVEANSKETSKPASEKDSLRAANDTGFLDFKQLCERLPLGERTLREAIKRRVIPHVRLPGGRRLLFHLPSVEAALLRYQQGGPDNLQSVDVK